MFDRASGQNNVPGPFKYVPAGRCSADELMTKNEDTWKECCDDWREDWNRTVKFNSIPNTFHFQNGQYQKFIFNVDDKTILQRKMVRRCQNRQLHSS